MKIRLIWWIHISLWYYVLWYNKIELWSNFPGRCVKFDTFSINDRIVHYGSYNTSVQKERAVFLGDSALLFRFPNPLPKDRGTWPVTCYCPLQMIHHALSFVASNITLLWTSCTNSSSSEIHPLYINKARQAPFNNLNDLNNLNVFLLHHHPQHSIIAVLNSPDINLTHPHFQHCHRLWINLN